MQLDTSLISSFAPFAFSVFIAMLFYIIVEYLPFRFINKHIFVYKLTSSIFLVLCYVFILHYMIEYNENKCYELITKLNCEMNIDISVKDAANILRDKDGKLKEIRVENILDGSFNNIFYKVENNNIVFFEMKDKKLIPY